MEQILSVKYEEKPCYDIVLSESFEHLFDHLHELQIEMKKICIVSDSNVAKIYQPILEGLLGGKCQSLIFFVFSAGEISKNTETVGKLYEHLIKNCFDRSDILLALGGGVVGDLTGFAAATYLRGVSFVQIPTTLLSQVDSSIGGKTGVDHLHYKNMVGAFKMPKLVYMNLSVLKSLPAEEFASGMGEVIKHGLIKDKSYYDFLKKDRDMIISLKNDAILRVVEGSCRVKRDVVERDPTEKGERALLNFGHTIGHAVEKLAEFKLPHGDCVSIGMAAAAFLSMQRGHLSEAELIDIEQTLVSYRLPIRIPKDLSLDAQEILQATKNDKKMVGDRVKFILLRHIGEAFIDMTLTDDELIDGVSYILN